MWSGGEIKRSLDELCTFRRCEVAASRHREHYFVNRHDISTCYFAIFLPSSFAILTVIYASVMAAGYSTFGDICEGNILLNYHPGDVLSTLGRVATGGESLLIGASQ